MTPKMKELGEKPFILTPLQAINRLFMILKVSKNWQKHTAAGIRWWSPTQLLLRRLVAYL
jgi:hypothetical protein